MGKPASDKPVLAIGPANYAGQASAWADAVSESGLGRGWSFQCGPTRRGSFRFPATKTIPLPLFRADLARGLRSRWLFRGTTHIALDGFQPYFRLFRTGKFEKDARLLESRGYQMALIAHGSDVRDPQAHMDRHPWSFFREGSQEWRDGLSASTAVHRGWADELGYPVFVSTPDLLLDLPQATWLPLTINPTQWATPPRNFEAKKLRVLHLPSRRVPPIKGTQYIEPVCQKLAAEGLIEYVAPAGSVAHAEMPNLVRSADILIDQILTGSYGVAALEGMAAGCVVVGNISDEVRALIPEDPPLIEAPPESLEDALREAIADRDRLRQLSAAGVAFASKWHDGRGSAKALSDYLASGR